jgi:Homeodomain-like domain-containing protein
MPRAVAVPLRQALWARQQQGQSPTTIAQELGLPLRTVQHLVQRFRQAEAVVPPAYRPGPRPPHALLPTVRAYRLQHPDWGAELIRVQLCRDHPDLAVPCGRTFQRWLARAGLGPIPTGRKAPPGRRRAESPHAVWQTDAAEHMALASGEEASWLRVVDECSGAFLQTRVSPPGAVE